MPKMGFPLVSEVGGNQKQNGRWGINLGRENSISENVYGPYRSRNDLYKPPNRESILPIHCATQKRISIHERIKENVEKLEENAPTSSRCVRK